MASVEPSTHLAATWSAVDPPSFAAWAPSTSATRDLLTCASPAAFFSSTAGPAPPLAFAFLAALRETFSPPPPELNPPPLTPSVSAARGGHSRLRLGSSECWCGRVGDAVE